jgi:hypothetical protein
MKKSKLQDALILLKEIRAQRTGDAKNSAVKKLDKAIRRIEKAEQSGNTEKISNKEILLTINLGLLTVEKFALFVTNIIEYFSR